ncbi:fused signal recognition particle receptor [Desulfitispora alkaliphila]|uniref:signal recognition particle-docking protein FtsY n=1 Tax=Desulfitispora alkaliphila TaxID=622674 RepID=UPI003D22B1B0
MSFFKKLKEGLTKTRKGLSDKVTELITGYKKIDEEFFEELEEIFIQADVGVNTSVALVDRLRERAKEEKIEDTSKVKGLLQEEVAKMLRADEASLNIENEGLTVIVVVGVNGVGKTTTIGKLCNHLKSEGKRVIMAAGDTFRAGAIDQLEVWGNRIGVDVIKHSEGSDPGAVTYDAIQAAKSRKSDVLVVDTAGRLQNKTNLMEELKKVRRVVEREVEGAPHEVLLVLDATTGQNAISQAKIFSEAVNVTGIVLTKLDGTAKGGVVLAINSELEIPVKYIGIGEKVEDLRPFNAQDFGAALFDDALTKEEGEE